MRLIFVSILSLVSVSARAQDYFSDNKYEKQFFGVSYGYGFNKWASIASEYKLWNQSGIKIIDGNSGLKAHSYSEIFDIEALLPLGNFRVGFGFNFEIFVLEELDIKMNGVVKTHKFPETFRSDKIFLMAERPYWSSDDKWELYAGVKTGLYSFSMINSTSLFGESRTGNRFFLQIKNGVDRKLTRNLYGNLTALLDYKYFSNSRQEHPRHIQHNIFTFALTMGLRMAFR